MKATVKINSSIPQLNSFLFNSNRNDFHLRCITSNFTINGFIPFVTALDFLYSLEPHRGALASTFKHTLRMYILLYISHDSNFMRSAALNNRPYILPQFMAYIVGTISSSVRSTNPHEGVTFGKLSRGSNYQDIIVVLKSLNLESIDRLLVNSVFEGLNNTAALSVIEQLISELEIINGLDHVEAIDKLLLSVSNFEKAFRVNTKPKFTNFLFKAESTALGIYRFRNAESKLSFNVQQHSLKLSQTTITLMLTFLRLFSPSFYHEDLSSPNVTRIAGDLTIDCSLCNDDTEYWKLYLSMNDSSFNFTEAFPNSPDTGQNPTKTVDNKRLLKTTVLNGNLMLSNIEGDNLFNVNYHSRFLESCNLIELWERDKSRHAISQYARLLR